MLTTAEAILDPSGHLKFLEGVRLDKAQRVLETFTGGEDEAESGLALSESSLAKDWLTDEEDTAWTHLQDAK